MLSSYYDSLFLVKIQVFMAVIESVTKRVFISLLWESLFLVKLQAVTIIFSFCWLIILAHIQSVAMSLKKKHVVLLKCSEIVFVRRKQLSRRVKK